MRWPRLADGSQPLCSQRGLYDTNRRWASVQIELDPKCIGLRYPIEVGLVGDNRNTLRGRNTERTEVKLFEIREAAGTNWEDELN